MGYGTGAGVCCKACAAARPCCRTLPPFGAYPSPKGPAQQRLLKCYAMSAFAPVATSEHLDQLVWCCAADPQHLQASLAQPCCPAHAPARPAAPRAGRAAPPPARPAPPPCAAAPPAPSRQSGCAARAAQSPPAPCRPRGSAEMKPGRRGCEHGGPCGWSRGGRGMSMPGCADGNKGGRDASMAGEKSSPDALQVVGAVGGLSKSSHSSTGMEAGRGQDRTHRAEGPLPRLTCCL